MMELIVGCGLRPKPGAVNLDKFPLPGVDVVFDLDGIVPFNERPRWRHEYLPYDDYEFDRIEAEDVLEHVRDMVTVFNELGRVLKVGGIIWIRGPHWRYSEALWNDPTHLRAFTERTFMGWVEGTYDWEHYGYYFHQGKLAFKLLSQIEKNKGLEITLERTR